MYGHESTSGSLQQSLLAAARRWESERASEAAQLRQRAHAANSRADAESEKLQAARTRTAELEQMLKEETKKVADESARADALNEQCTRHRLQALGCFLILGKLRERLQCMNSKKVPAITNKAAAEEEAVSDAEADDTDKEEAPAKSKNAAKKAKKRAAAAAAAAAEVAEAEAGGEVAVVGGENGVVANGTVGEAEIVTVDGELIVKADDYDAVQAVIVDLPTPVSREELVAACHDGKGRAVDGFFSQFVLSEAVEQEAQEALVEALEAGTVANRGAIIKTLIDGGCDAHRTAALHLSIKHGHVSILAHLVSKVGMSVNTVDADGSSPLHIAALANQPKAAQFLLKNSASIDATDAEGRTALDIAMSLRWREMQRVLTDPATLFFNRAARATRLYKQGEFELACETYEVALSHMEEMGTPPPAENRATFYFNYARAAQSASSLTRAIDLFNHVLTVSPRHERAISGRAECHASLGDLDSAMSDLRELTSNYAAGAEASVRQGWNKRLAEVSARLKEEPHKALGVERFATPTEIRKAYRAACLQYHPDKHASSTDDARAKAKFKFERIQAAYEKLSASGSGASEFMRASAASRTSAYTSTYGRPGAPPSRPPPPPPQPSYSQGSHWWRTDDSFEGEEEEEEEAEEEEEEEPSEPPGYVPGGKRWTAGYGYE